MGVTLVGRVRAQLAGAAGRSGQLLTTLTVADRLCWLEDHAAADAADHGDAPTSAARGHPAARRPLRLPGHRPAGPRRGRSGAVTVLVSHRFSTVRTADLAVVLEDGRVRELGSHEQLVAAAGRHAELSALQAADSR